MTNLVVLAVCFALGVLLRRSGRLPPDAHKVLNAFVVNVALPALVLRHVHGLRLDGQLMLPAAMPWVMFALGALFFAGLGRLAGWPRETTGGLMLAGGLANTSFVGLPMIEAFYGPAFLSVGILADQLGTYLVLSTFGVLVAALCSSAGPVRPGVLARRVATFPPFQALALGLVLMPFDYPEALSAVLDRLAGTLTPIALVSVGFQLRLNGLGTCRGELTAGLLYKLVLGPALVALIFVLGLRAGGAVLQVTLFEAAMGPQIGGAIIAIEHGLNARLVTLMVGLGIPLSLLTAALWSQLLGAL
jgi:malate permease and related proteins